MSILSQIRDLKENGFSTKGAIEFIWVWLLHCYAPIARYYIIPGSKSKEFTKEGWYLRFKLGKFEKWVLYREGKDLFDD